MSSCSAHGTLTWSTAIGTLCTGCATLFFALIDTRASYWPFGFPAAILAVVGADFVFAAGTLFVAKVAAHDEQSLAGATFQTMTQVRARTFRLSGCGLTRGAARDVVRPDDLDDCLRPSRSEHDTATERRARGPARGISRCAMDRIRVRHAWSVVPPLIAGQR
jgi:hypothetical protein